MCAAEQVSAAAPEVPAERAVAAKDGAAAAGVGAGKGPGAAKARALDAVGRSGESGGGTGFVRKKRKKTVKR
ncbi:hypothetical protein KNP414_00226 [Paenibacillus mucilaginosus KNP414]|uniref:Uncharacterized protein n=1 Tax=Paenibacillus mucilaginosus (strain KNP414) TaxID=1036673 RepID=F8FL08_PAEMK|nr:hypothetical protein KNP414_00226 [Paenibacillus mucilaginosus KNP414]